MTATKKSLAKNSIYYLIYNVLNVIFPFLTGIYVARVLLPDTVGMVEYARNIAQYFVIFAFLGIPTYGLREIAKCRDDQEQLNRLHTELLIINFISTVFFLAVYFILIFSVARFRENSTLYMIVGISIALNALNNAWLFEGLEEFKFISIRNVVFKVLSFVLLVVFVRGDDDVYIYALITVVGTAGNYVLNILRSKKFVSFTFQGLSFKRHFKPIAFLVAVNLAIELYSLVDVTMLGIFCEDKNVAYYSYAMKIHKIFLQVMNTFTMVLVPRISYAYKHEDYEEVNGLLGKTLTIIFMLALPLIVGIYFVADYVIVLLYTDVYITSASILKLLSVTLLMSPVGYLLGSRVLLISGHENKMVIAVGIGAVVNVIGNAILIPRYQEMGAVIASVTSEFIVMAIYVCMGKKYFTLRGIWKNVVKILASAIIMGGLLYALTWLPVAPTWLFIVQVVTGILGYFGLLLLFRETTVVSSFNQIIGKFTNGRTER